MSARASVSCFVKSGFVESGVYGSLSVSFLIVLAGTLERSPRRKSLWQTCKRSNRRGKFGSEV